MAETLSLREFAQQIDELDQDIAHHESLLKEIRNQRSKLVARRYRAIMKEGLTWE
jgi:hypothetical protein